MKSEAAHDTVAALRESEYPARSEGPFFNAASWGLLPRSTIAEVADLTARRNRPHGFEESELGRIQHRCRTQAARLIGGQPEEVSLVPNTSVGIGLAVALVGTGPPGTIIVSEGEFPANVLPWRALEARGFALTVVPLDPGTRLPDEAALLAALEGPDVRALSLSAVQYASGYRADLSSYGAVCRERGIVFCVDAIQQLGASPFDAREAYADVVACGGQKWLCSPWGSGFAWVRRELQARFDPQVVSWLGVEGATRFEEPPAYELRWRDDGRKFEPATLGIQDYLGLARSLEILQQAEIAAIRDHILRVHQPLVDWIETSAHARLWTPVRKERRAGIISFFTDRLEASVAALEEMGVVFAVRDGAIRFAPHLYNTVEEMQRVVERLDAVA